MWLINVETRKLQEFMSPNVPKYVILSHRWTDDEVSFKEFSKGRRQESLGSQKIVDFCHTVEKFYEDNIEWVWVDTVCIDKRSSAELAESINSMWAYYENSVECYVYLNDVHALRALDEELGLHLIRPQIVEELHRSVWFTRGWTLQELLAPHRLTFLSVEWCPIGELTDLVAKAMSRPEPPSYRNLLDLSEDIHDITQIPLRVLHGRKSVDDFSVAQRMSWASKRETTRLEDEAYCLLGLFDINMPLIYGEGRKAFRRLQQEIIREIPDQSIFACHDPGLGLADFSVLATSPAAFAHAGNVRRLRAHPIHPSTIGNLGLELQAALLPIPMPRGPYFYLLPLSCGSVRPPSRELFTIYIFLIQIACGHYCRILQDRQIVGRYGLDLGYLEAQNVCIHASPYRYRKYEDGARFSEDVHEFMQWMRKDGERHLQDLGLEISFVN